MSFDFGRSSQISNWRLGGRLRRRLVALLEMMQEIVGVNDFVVHIAEKVGPYCMTYEWLRMIVE